MFALLSAYGCGLASSATQTKGSELGSATSHPNPSSSQSHLPNSSTTAAPTAGVNLAALLLNAVDGTGRGGQPHYDYAPCAEHVVVDAPGCAGSSASASVLVNAGGRYANEILFEFPSPAAAAAAWQAYKSSLQHHAVAPTCQPPSHPPCAIALEIGDIGVPVVTFSAKDLQRGDISTVTSGVIAVKGRFILSLVGDISDMSAYGLIGHVPPAVQAYIVTVLRNLHT